jgi:hypothetical protein
VDYKAEIVSTLSGLSCPVAFFNYTGTATTYVTFFCYSENCEDYAENTEIASKYSVQIDVWSKTNAFETIAGQIKTAMLAAGWVGYSAQDMYENDTKIFRKMIQMEIKA